MIADILNKIKLIFTAPKLSGGNSTISAEHLKGYNESRHKKLQHNFCYAPSVNMLFAQDGSVRVCCHNLEHNIGCYPAQSIDEIWNSDKANELRIAMNEFNLTKGCEVCQHDVDLGAYREVTARHFDSLPQNTLYPTMMEFLLSNVCNLECEMCQGDFSSLIRKNREKLPPLQSPYGSDFIHQIKPYLKNLHEARFSGSGEAFAIDVYYELWEYLITENPRCKIVIQTNGTILNARVKDLLERGNFQIGVSLDSLQKDRFEAIRINAKFERVIENIRYFSDYSIRKKHMFLVAMCVMRSNWDELPAFVTFCTSLNAYAKFHQVHSPEHLSLTTLSSAKLNDIFNHLLAQVNTPAEGVFGNRNLEHLNYFVNLVIKNWIHQAAIREANQHTVSLEVLQQQFYNSLKELGQQYSDDDLIIFQQKLELVIDNCDNEEKKIKLYKHILKMPPQMIVGAMLKYPEDYLLKERDNIFKI